MPPEGAQRYSRREREVIIERDEDFTEQHENKQAKGNSTQKNTKTHRCTQQGKVRETAEQNINVACFAPLSCSN